VAPATAAAAAREVARHLATAPEFARCRKLVLYAAVAGELPLEHVLAAARAAGKTPLWPRVLAGARMVFARADRIEELAPGRYGVREPASGTPEEALGADVLALVPGVAFDERGGRLGRGGGLWDRALAEAKGAVALGVGYELQVVDAVPCEAHDRRLDGLLTEAGIRRFGAS
jgi:5-formyltetrahydrofolate cyclo-ligase